MTAEVQGLQAGSAKPKGRSLWELKCFIHKTTCLTEHFFELSLCSMDMGQRFAGLLRGLGWHVALLVGASFGLFGQRAFGAPLTVCATVGMVADLARGVG